MITLMGPRISLRMNLWLFGRGGRLLDGELRDCAGILGTHTARKCRLVAPDTLLRWYLQLDRWRWTYLRQGGHPPIDARLAVLIEQVARENPRASCR
jgi:hypothetical protein